MRRERLVDTEVGFGRGGFQLCYNLVCLVILVTVLWLSRPESRGWRGGQHWHRRADRRTYEPTNGQIWRLLGYIHVS